MRKNIKQAKCCCLAKECKYLFKHIEMALNTSKTFYLALWTRFLTKSSKSIDPTRDRLPCQSDTHIVTEMVAVLGDKMISVPRIVFC